MSAELYAVLALSLIIITALVTFLLLSRSENERVVSLLIMKQGENERVVSLLIMKQGERELEWNRERQQLLDRIQAPSFGELKQAEVKTIKAQQGIKDPVPLEPL